MYDASFLHPARKCADSLPPVADAKQSHLDTKYSIFGRVIDGADTTLDALVRSLGRLSFPLD